MAIEHDSYWFNHGDVVFSSAGGEEGALGPLAKLHTAHGEAGVKGKFGNKREACVLFIGLPAPGALAL